MNPFILLINRYFSLVIIMTLLIPVCFNSGCSSLILQTTAKKPITSPAKVDLVSLKTRLDEDSWAPRKNWINAWIQSENIEKQYYHHYRWKYGDINLPDQVAVLTEIQSEIINETPQPEKKKNKRRKKTIKKIKSPLYQLAKEDSVAGWNASIFLAFSNPEEAVDFLERLKTISTTQVKYDPSNLMIVQEHEKMFKTVSIQNKKSSFAKRIIKAAKILTSDGIESEDKVSEKSGLPKEEKFEPDDKKETEYRYLSKDMKLAALSAWCYVLSQKEDTPLEGLAEAGLLLESSTLSNEFRGELIRNVAQWIPVHDIPDLEKTFKDHFQVNESDKKNAAEKKKEFTQLRLASLEACIISGLIYDSHREKLEAVKYDNKSWPVNISICSYDNLSEIRRAYGKWVVVSHHPDAIKILKSQLNDQEFSVRDSAVFNLGILQTDQAKKELERLADENKDRLRVKSVEALTNYGIESIIPFANDSSHAVRKAVAEGLDHYPSVESALLLHHLIVDKHPEVQIAATKTIRDWPVKYSVPIWGHGFSNALRATRRLCAQLLIQASKNNETLSFDEPQDKRISQIKSFAKNNDFPLTLIGLIDEKKKPEGNAVDYHAQQEIFADLNSITNPTTGTPIDQVALRRLKNLDPKSTTVIEEFLETHTSLNSSIIYIDILPNIDPAYKLLLDMEKGNIQDRRKAAQKLSLIGQNKSLSQTLIRRLRIVLNNEQDRLIWRYSMNGIMNDRNEEISTLAKHAAHHQWADIRILGCEYAYKHPSTQYANWLLPLFQDSDSKVRIKAIEAAGRTGNSILIDGLPAGPTQEALPGLTSLLVDSKAEIRFAATFSLCLLHNERGYQELIRLGYHDSAKIRESVVSAMGETKQTMFVKHLIQMAWTENNHSVKRAILSSLNQIVPEIQRDPKLKTTNQLQEQIEIWAKWQQSSQNHKLSLHTTSTSIR